MKTRHFNPFRMRTYRKSAHNPLEINTYEKSRGVGVRADSASKKRL